MRCWAGRFRCATDDRHCLGLRPLRVTECLLHRVAEGQQAAVKELLDRYGGLVYSLARRFCFEPGDIDDAVQDIFTAIWQSSSRFDPSLGSEETFVAMVARRRLIDRRRRAQRRHMPSVDGEVLGQTVQARPEGVAEDLGEEAQRAGELLKRLRPEQQTVIRLSICQGLSHEQIAELTGMPLGTVKTHVRRGLIALREAMSPTPAKARTGEDEEEDHQPPGPRARNADHDPDP